MVHKAVAHRVLQTAVPVKPVPENGTYVNSVVRRVLLLDRDRIESVFKLFYFLCPPHILIV